MNTFKPATRHAVKLKLGLMGPSGSGKTFSALRLAHGLCAGGRVALLDTENGSASLYADRFQFDVLEMHSPFTVQKFMAAIQDATTAGYDCLILDSISAEWQELLTEKEALDARGGNSFTNWASITKKHEEFKKAFLQSSIHLIACMRSKQEYVLQTNEKGKQAPIKVGMGAVQREGFEYEASIVFDLDMQHNAKASKDRSSLFSDNDLFQITEDTGKTLLEWLKKGGAPVPEDTTAAPATAPQASASPVRPRAQSVTQPVVQAPPAIEQGDAVSEAWVSAISELACITVDMPNKTRVPLIKLWEDEGPQGLPALLKEITMIKSTLAPKETAQEAIQAEQVASLERKDQPSQEASDFVDDLTPNAQTENCIDKDQYEALGALLAAYGVNRDCYRAYSANSGHLLPCANGPTLARLKASEFGKLREKLQNKRIAAKNESWSARTIRIINATPTTTFTPKETK